MPNCFFCNDFCNGKTKVSWCGEHKICCPTCFSHWASHDNTYLWEKRKIVIDKEMPWSSEHRKNNGK
jgi:hypothetical protein